jgi:uncharacterized protein
MHLGDVVLPNILMDLTLTAVVFICLLLFIVAFLYSSVGYGGASGYLAVLSLFAIDPNAMASTALLLNIVVAGIAFITYYRAGYFSYRLTIPFLIGSVPLAFLGGMVYISKEYYSVLLAIALTAAAIRLMMKFESQAEQNRQYTYPNMTIALPIGGAIGFISGIVGVGGGIFLSPLILLSKWADPKYTSATAAFFIVVNSSAGIFGRVIQGNFTYNTFIPFIAASVLGGIAGSRWGSKKFSNLTLCRMLGIVLLITAVRLLLNI